MSRPLDILGQLAEHLKKALQTELSVQMRVASGTLINSIEAVVKKTLSGFEIVGSAVYYAKYVENGRRAGAKGVPIEALIEWIRIKRIVIDGRSERSTAFMFQSSIRRKGIAPSLFITRTLQNQESTIDRSIHAACGELVNYHIETMFNEIKQAA